MAMISLYTRFGFRMGFFNLENQNTNAGLKFEVVTKNVCLYGWYTLTDQNSTLVKGLQNHTYSQFCLSRQTTRDCGFYVD